MNKSIHWLYQQHGGIIMPGDARCYLCGVACQELYTVAKGIADTFNSHYLASCPSSSWLCDACQWYFNDKSHPEFRKMSLIVTPSTWQNWQRETMKGDIRQWLEDGLSEEGYLVVSLSKKKHILLQAILNGARSKVLAIQIEEQVAYADLASWSGIDSPFMKLLALGHGKGEILSGNLYSSTLRKHGQIEQALYYNNQLSRWRNGPLIELYSYVTMIGEKEDDGTGSTDELSEGARNTTDSRRPSTGRVERYRQGVSQQVSHGNMEDVRGKGSDGNTDYQQLDLFSE